MAACFYFLYLVEMVEADQANFGELVLSGYLRTMNFGGIVTIYFLD